MFRYPRLQQFLATGSVYTGRVDRLGGAEQREHGSAVRVLRYQRVANLRELPFPPYRTSVVTPEQFRAQMEYLKSTAEIIDLSLLLHHWTSLDELPPRSVVLTFDGGFIDHYNTAIPILDDLGIASTLFVPTAFINTNNLFWPDKVQAVLLSLQRAGRRFPKFDTLSAEVNFSLQQEQAAILPIKILFLLEVLQQIPKEILSYFMQELAIAAHDVELISIPRTFLSWEELLKINGAGHSIASLSHSNRRFTEIPREELAAELHVSIGELRREGFTPIPVVAAPDGAVSPEVFDTLQAIGCGICATIGRGSYPKESDSFVTVERVSISHDNSNTVDLFACRVWGAKILNQFIC